MSSNLNNISPGGYNLVSYEKFDEALNNINTSSDCNLAEAMSNLSSSVSVNAVSDSSSYLDIANNIYSLNNSVNRLASGDGVIKLIDNYKTGYNDIKKAIINAYIAEYEFMCETGEIDQYFSKFPEGERDSYKEQFINMLKNMKDKNNSTDTLSQYAGLSEFFKQIENSLGTIESHTTNYSFDYVEINGEGGYLYIPEGFSSDDKLPLITWFAGSGKSSINIMKTNGLPAALDNNEAVNAIVWCPCSYTNYSYSRHFETMQEIIKTYNIDEERVSLFGYSLGAETAYCIAREYPNYFSTVVTYGTPGRYSDINSTDTTFIMYQGSNDKYGDGLGTYEELQESGSQVIYYKLQGANHGDVQAMFTKDMLDDVVNIKRGDKFSNTPTEVINVETSKESGDCAISDNNYYVRLSSENITSSNDDVVLTQLSQEGSTTLNVEEQTVTSTDSQVIIEGIGQPRTKKDILIENNNSKELNNLNDVLASKNSQETSETVVEESGTRKTVDSSLKSTHKVSFEKTDDENSTSKTSESVVEESRSRKTIDSSLKSTHTLSFEKSGDENSTSKTSESVVEESGSRKTIDSSLKSTHKVSFDKEGIAKKDTDTYESESIITTVEHQEEISDNSNTTPESNEPIITTVEHQEEISDNPNTTPESNESVINTSSTQTVTQPKRTVSYSSSVSSNSQSNDYSTNIEHVDNTVLTQVLPDNKFSDFIPNLTNGQLGEMQISNNYVTYNINSFSNEDYANYINELEKYGYIFSNGKWIYGNYSLTLNYSNNTLNMHLELIK